MVNDSAVSKRKVDHLASLGGRWRVAVPFITSISPQWRERERRNVLRKDLWFSRNEMMLGMQTIPNDHQLRDEKKSTFQAKSFFRIQLIFVESRCVCFRNARGTKTGNFGISSSGTSFSLSHLFPKHCSFLATSIHSYIAQRLFPFCYYLFVV